jgi:hypothetical protein
MQVSCCIKNARFIKYPSFPNLQIRTDITNPMKDRMKSMEENVMTVRKRNKIFYAIVGLQFRNMYFT